MRFKEWLAKQEINEVGTGTASIAVFARPVMSMVSRTWAPFITSEIEPPKKKKKKKKKKSS